MKSKSAGKSVLFLDTENHDLSRIAEVVFNSVAGKMGLPWSATSRGFIAKLPTKKEGPMATEAVKSLRLRGIRTSDFDRNPIQVTEEDVESANRIVVLNVDEQHSALRELLTGVSAEVEHSRIDPAADPIPAVDREIGNLVARLLGGKASEETPPEPPTSKSSKPATVKVGRETKGRRGKGVTLISEVPLDAEKLQELATLLKGRCGTGGTVKDGRIEIQGDQRDRITTELEQLGYRVKRVGG